MTYVNVGEIDEVMTAAVAEIRAPRAEIELSCTLRRSIGSPIAVQTMDVGPRGMRVRSPRPLMADETVTFDLPNLDMRLAGRARVITLDRPQVYSLRFENLPGPMIQRLHALAINAR